MFRRNLAEPLSAALADSPIVFLQGARQTGKSTLVQWLAKEIHPARYLTFDDPTVLGAAQDDPVGFLTGVRGPVVLDEVQRVPALFPAIKAAVDRDRQPGRFLLTGSADVLLLPRIAEMLTGRVELLTLWPFSQGELAGLREGFVDALFEVEFPDLEVEVGSHEDILDRVLVGGFPEAVRRSEADRREAWLGSYVALLIQRDIRDLATIEHAAAFPRLLRMLAARTGTFLNYAALASGLQLPQTTLKRYMAYLETLFIYQPVAPWATNIGKRLVKSPKITLVDTGLGAYLLGLAAQRLAEDPSLVGHLFENFVVNELKKQITWSQRDPALFCFRTHSQQEVGIVLEDRAGGVVGIEVKGAHTVNGRDFAGLKLLESSLGKRFVRGIVLYLGGSTVPFGRRLLAVPLSALWTIGVESRSCTS